MSHLKLEELARLVDEAPAVDEQAHLGECDVCRGELEALTEQRLALGALPDLAPPPDAWPALRSRLRQEGLVRPEGAWRGRRVLAMPLARAAAAAFLFLAGGAAGYAARDVSAPSAPSAPAAPMAAGPVATAADPELAVPAGQDANATRDVEAASELFMDALDRYMASTGASPGDPAARLAALDNIVLTTAEALHEAPADPVINGYHLSALAQRDAVLRQLAVRAGDPVF